METMKGGPSFVLFTCVYFFLICRSWTSTSAAEVTCPPCTAPHWNESWSNKKYFIQNTNAEYGYRVRNSLDKTFCPGLGSESERLMIQSAEENDFIVDLMKQYIPGSDSQVFISCTANATTGPNRKWNCEDPTSVYRESGTDKGFWDWRAGMPFSTNGKCVLLDSSDGSWLVSGCGNKSDFVVCQCWPDPTPSFNSRSLYFRAVSSDTKNCFNSTEVIRLVDVPNAARCARECRADDQCTSFNLYQTDVNTTSCELLVDNAASNLASALYHQPNCRYYESFPMCS